MSHSDDPVFIAIREQVRTTLDKMVSNGQLVSEVAAPGRPFSEFLDASMAGVISQVVNDELHLGWEPHDMYGLVANASVWAEHRIIEWMRANPAAVEAIMRGAKK